jgi:hypothetical protein
MVCSRLEMAKLQGQGRKTPPILEDQFFMGFRGPKAHSNRPGGLSYISSTKVILTVVTTSTGWPLSSVGW